MEKTDRFYSFLTDFRETGEGSLLAQVRVSGNSPWFSGHFPGNPILPGIAQLKMVVDAIAAFRKQNLCIQGLNRIKFKDIVRPGEVLSIQVFAADASDQYAFRITSRDKEVCSGMVRLAVKNHQATT